MPQGLGEAGRVSPSAGLAGASPLDAFQGSGEEEDGGQGLGVNLPGLLGTPQGDPMQQEMMRLMMLLEELMMKLQQQMAAGDEQGATDTRNQIQALQGQMGGAPGAASGGASGGGYAPSAGGSAPSSGSAPSAGGDSSAAPGAGAVQVDPSQMGEGTQWGKALAAEAFSKAGPTSQGRCYEYVGNALRKFGVQTSGEGAYMAADQLAKSDKFQEARGISNQDLTKLPAGAVVVWNRGNGHEWGHISIADGHGHEASDFKGNQITNYGTSFRVFLPKGSTAGSARGNA
jgi:hypothetical protein